MASGLPVIAAAKGGVLESVRAGITGLLAEPGNPAAFAEAIVRLARDAELRNRLSVTARAYALRRSWQAVFSELFDCYQEIVAQPSMRVA
jgi:glycosyltransferase involved in cell wall biosynthesis